MDLFGWMSELINNLGQKVLEILPKSPFRNFIDSWQPPQYIAWLNWFFPVHELLLVFAVWLTAITVFLLYSVIMRWIKIIGD